MDIKNFSAALAQIAEEKGIPPEKVLETIEQALVAAYKKDYGKKGQIIKAKLDPKSGEIKFWQIKLVVDEKMIYSEKELEKLKTKFAPGKEPEEKVKFNPEKHILIEEAKKIRPKIKTGEELITPLQTQKDY